MNNPWTIAIMATELMSVLICLILLFGNERVKAKQNRRGMLYSLMCLANIVALACDAVSWILDGHQEHQAALSITTFLSINLTYVLLALFASYLTCYIRERRPVLPMLLKLVHAFCTVAILVTTVFCLSGRMYSYENGVYTIGPLYVIYSVVSALSLIVGMAFVMICRKSLTKNENLATFLYISLPAVSALIGIIFPEFSFVYPANTLSLLVLYSMLQAEQTSLLQQENQASLYYALHDTLTGLYSRRAYIERVDQLTREIGLVGVIFCDVNGLKYTNDHYGHEAGDQLLIRFSNLLNGLFRREEVFRISGDEFVILMADIPEAIFRQRVQMLQEAVEEENYSIACIGSEYGSRLKLEELVRMAEAAMYERKDVYHKEHPELKR